MFIDMTNLYNHIQFAHYYLRIKVPCCVDNNLPLVEDKNVCREVEPEGSKQQSLAIPMNLDTSDHKVRQIRVISKVCKENICFM